MAGIQEFQLRDGVLETFSHSDATGNYQRPSGKRHAIAHLVDHVSFDVVDHVTSNIPDTSFPALCLNSSHASRTHCVDLDWLYERIHLGNLMPIRCARTTEQLAAILSKGAFQPCV